MKTAKTNYIKDLSNKLGWSESPTSFEKQYTSFEKKQCILVLKKQYTSFQNQYTSFEKQYTSFEKQYTIFQNQYTTFENQYTTFQNQYTTFQNQYTTFSKLVCTTFFQNQYTTFQNQYATFQNWQRTRTDLIAIDINGRSFANLETGQDKRCIIQMNVNIYRIELITAALTLLTKGIYVFSYLFWHDDLYLKRRGGMVLDQTLVLIFSFVFIYKNEKVSRFFKHRILSQLLCQSESFADISKRSVPRYVFYTGIWIKIHQCKTGVFLHESSDFFTLRLV